MQPPQLPCDAQLDRLGDKQSQRADLQQRWLAGSELRWKCEEQLPQVARMRADHAEPEGPR